MKVNELIAKLLLCPQDFDIVLATVERLQADRADSEDFHIRLNQPINQIFKDENEKEILFFTTESRIEISHPGVSEIVADATMYHNGVRHCIGGPPISTFPPLYEGANSMPMAQVLEPATDS